MDKLNTRPRYVRQISEFEPGMSFRYDVPDTKVPPEDGSPELEWRYWTVTASVVGEKEILLPGFNSREMALGQFAIFSVFENARSRSPIKTEEAYIMPRPAGVNTNPKHHGTYSVQENFATDLAVIDEDGKSAYDRRLLAARNIRSRSLRILAPEL